MASKEELINQFAAIPVQQKLGITMIIVLLIVGGYYGMYYTDQVAKIDKLRDQITQLDKSLLEKQAIANNLPKFRREVERLNQKLREALSLLPNTADIPDLLTKVADQAEKSGLMLKKFQLGDETPKQFYAEVPVSMEVVGSYHELAVFFDKISKMPRIVNVANLSISKPEIRAAKVYFESKFSATTYRFLDTPAGGAPGAPPKPAGG